MDLQRQYRTIKKEVNLAINRVFSRSSFILGPEGQYLEKEFSRYLGAKYAVGVNSGTDALFLALKACGIQPGDEVITSAFGYIASILGVSFCGAKPVLVDADFSDANIDVTAIEKAITKKTRAILPVHLYGQACQMGPILNIAKKYRLKIIEDCAQSHGAKLRLAGGQWGLTGTFGDAGCFSFYPTKNMGAYGDGGMIVTADAEIYRQALLLRDYGRKDRYAFAIKGYNSRLDELQAAVLRVKLKRLDSWNKRRQQISAWYREFLENEDIVLNATDRNSAPVYHLLVAKTKNRMKLQDYLKRAGVGTGIHYPIPLHLQEAYRDLRYHRGDFPVAERLANEVLSLPMFPELKESEVRYICRKLNAFKG